MYVENFEHAGGITIELSAAEHEVLEDFFNSLCLTEKLFEYDSSVRRDQDFYERVEWAFWRALNRGVSEDTSLPKEDEGL